MRACVYEGAGDASVLTIRTVEDPEPGPGQVLIQVAVGERKLGRRTAGTAALQGAG